MVDFNDRRGLSRKPGFNLITPGYAEQDAWADQPLTKNSKKDVHSYFRQQSETPAKTWAEGNKLAQRRAAHEVRTRGVSNTGEYASAYQDHLVRVLSHKGESLAAKHGEDLTIPANDRSGRY